jgi:hypothetical protein
MAAHEFDRPVINLHELVNGLIKYYNPTFNCEVLGKPNDKQTWGYYQTLGEITELLNSVDHYKTSRLAHYHIKNRQDTIADQVPFYNYINDNFYIISAQRDNLFEHALSWCIQVESKKLNVYSHQEKIDTFANIYQNRIQADPRTMVNYLNQYVEYIAWVNNHFHVNSYFKYDQDMANIEEYIMGLNIFNGQEKRSWKDIFDIEFQDWNKCHYLISDLSGVSRQLPGADKPRLEYNGTTDFGDYQIQSLKKNEIITSLNERDQLFVKNNAVKYVQAHKAIDELVENKVLVTPVPIKLQTMLEKRLLIKNFDQLADVYNEWSAKTGHGVPYTREQLAELAFNEIKNYHSVPKLTMSSTND